MPQEITLQGHFTDSAKWNSEQKTAVSVRDGVLEYLGAEIGCEPADQVFTVYRSPATIANTAALMANIPLTDEHVDLDNAVTDSMGNVVDARMIDLMDANTNSKLAIQNKVNLQDAFIEVLSSGKRELSLGYKADLVPHSEYDFEQKNILPHHLAVVQAGRCGSACSFIDRKPSNEGSNMPKQTKTAAAVKSDLPKEFLDADGQPSLEQIVEIAQKLPEALKRFPMDKLQEIMPTLKEIVSFAADAGVEMPAEEEMTDGESYDEDKEKKEPVNVEDSAAFKDAVKSFKDKELKEAIERHSEVVDKAVGFVDESYVFKGKDTAQVMRDALATQYGSQKFEDSELATAFKMLKPQASNLKNFGDKSPNTDRFADIADKEL